MLKLHLFVFVEHMELHNQYHPANSSQYHQNVNSQLIDIDVQQQQNPVKQSTNTGPKNLYLAFIASRHLSALDDPLLES